MTLLWSLLPLLLIALGYAVGSFSEYRHITRLRRREAELADMVVTDLPTVPDDDSVTAAHMVMGEVVIATDYFKSFASQLRALVGGEIRSLQTLVDRARREALCRLLEQARDLGASEVHNVRLETSNIHSANRRSKGISVEMLAFGTAVSRQTS